MEIVKPGANINFVSIMGKLGVVSVILLMGVIGLIVTQGFNYGIDFQGGTEVLVKFKTDTDASIVRDALVASSMGDPQVKKYGMSTTGGSEFLIKVKDTGTGLEEGNGENISDNILKALEAKVGVGNVEKLRSSVVGPKAGNEFRQKGRNAVLVSLAMLLIYIAIRFKFVYGIGALAALVHDTLIVIGALILYDVEFNLTTVAALLTIVGYSVNDTIVIFDRIRENASKFKTKSLSDQINIAINETLSRTVITSLLTFLAVEALLILGGGDVHDFAFAVMIGIITGTYSSIYIASAVVILWEDTLGPRWENTRDKVKQRV